MIMFISAFILDIYMNCVQTEFITWFICAGVLFTNSHMSLSVCKRKVEINVCSLHSMFMFFIFIMLVHISTFNHFVHYSQVVKSLS